MPPSSFIVTAPVVYANRSTTPRFVQPRLPTLHLPGRTRLRVGFRRKGWAFIPFLARCADLAWLPDADPAARSPSVLNRTRGEIRRLPLLLWPWCTQGCFSPHTPHALCDASAFSRCTLLVLNTTDLPQILSLILIFHSNLSLSPPILVLST